MLSKPLPLLRGAATAAMRLPNWPRASGYLHLASEVAAALMNPWARIEALEQLGEARWQQEDHAGAVDAWLRGKQLAEQVGHVDGRH